MSAMGARNRNADRNDDDESSQDDDETSHGNDDDDDGGDDDRSSKEGDRDKEDKISRSVYIEGLPFDATDSQVHAFFKGLKILSCRLPRCENNSKRLLGYGYVEFESIAHQKQALKRSGKYLGKRYLTVLPSRYSKRARERDDGGDHDEEDQDLQSEDDGDEDDNARDDDQEEEQDDAENEEEGDRSDNGDSNDELQTSNDEGEEEKKKRRKRKRKRKNQKKDEDDGGSDDDDDDDRDADRGMDNGGDDTVARTVYVEGIPWNATESQVRDFFKGLPIMSCRLPTFRDSGRLSGYGHVEFKTLAHQQDALKLSGKYLGGRYLRVLPAKHPNVVVATSFVVAPSTAESSNNNNNSKSSSLPEPSRTIMLKNLSYDATEDDVRKAVSKFGEIASAGGSIRIPRHNRSRQSKGFAYVDFVDVLAAQRAYTSAMKGTPISIRGRPCIVDYDHGSIQKSFRTETGRLWQKEYGKSHSNDSKKRHKKDIR